MNWARVGVVVTCLELEGVGEATVRKLLASGCDLLSEIQMLEFLHQHARREICLADYVAASARAERILDDCETNGIEVLLFDEAGFPPLARVDLDTPPILYVMGGTPLRSGVAIVGTRRPSNRSARVAEKLGERAASLGVPVLSGFAKGVDEAAHTGCVNAGGRTIAVVGGGVVTVSNRNPDFLSRILDCSGAFVSAYPPLSEVAPYKLVARDRLLASLSLGVVVVESAIDGGSMHAARHARSKLKRPVAVIGPIEGQLWERDNAQIMTELGATTLRDGDAFDGWCKSLTGGCRDE